MTIKRDPEEQSEQLVHPAARPSKQDSESSSPSHAARAARLADDIITRPLNDTQAIELAKVYALLAIHERMPVPRKPATRTTKDKS